MKVPSSECASRPGPNGLASDAEPPPAAQPASAEWLEGGRALLNLAEVITDLNEELAKWLGSPRKDLLGRAFGETLQRRCAGLNFSLTDQAGDEAPWTVREFSVEDNGRRSWFRLETARNSAGWFIRLNSTVPPLDALKEEGGGGSPKDAPEAQKLRLRLLRAESQLERLIRGWPGVLFSQRADFSFQYVSPKIEELTGLPALVWRNQPRRFWEIVHEADIDDLRRQCLQAAKTPGGVATTYRIRHAVTGQISYILEHRQAEVSKSGLVLGYEGFWLDVTRQTVAEKRLSSAAWKETLALLTMGLAHDFSNLLSGILSLSELIISKLGPEHACTPTLEMIKKSSLQASQLVQRIVNLHRSKTGVHQYIDLNQAVSELVDLVSKVLPRRICVQTEQAPDQVPVYMDAVEFRQVVLNLALNAADAMPNRGVLVFRVSAHSTAQELANTQGQFPRLPAGCLSVQDNGTGIPARHLAHIFDPFFTTKPLTKGSGLGLYNAKLFVEEHGGAISVESKEGTGTTFHLWLPQADFSEAERMAAQKAQRRRSVLLVGQPGLATDTVAEFLRTHSYYVVATHSPGRAIELLVSEENSLHGVMVLAEPSDKAMLGLLSDLRDRRLARCIILQLIGGDSDQADQRIVEKASLVLASDLEESVVIQKLDHLFSADPLA